MKEAIAALKAGDRNSAFSLLSRHLAAHPKDAAAWLWMSEVVQEPAQQIDALHRVLVLEPTHPKSDAIRQRLRTLQATTQPQPSILDVPAPGTNTSPGASRERPMDDALAQLRGESLASGRAGAPRKLINTPEPPPEETTDATPGMNQAKTDRLEEELFWLDPEGGDSPQGSNEVTRARVYDGPADSDDDTDEFMRALFAMEEEPPETTDPEDATLSASAPPVTLSETLAPPVDPLLSVPALELPEDAPAEPRSDNLPKAKGSSDDVPGWIWVIMALSILLLGLFLVLVYFYSSGSL